MSRLIDADKLIRKLKRISTQYWLEHKKCNASQMVNDLQDVINNTPTVNEWHYPSKGDYPTERDWYLGVFEEADTGFELVPVVCDYVGHKTKATTDEGWIINHCTDVDNPLDYYKKLKCVAWQYIIPPKEEA